MWNVGIVHINAPCYEAAATSHCPSLLESDEEIHHIHYMVS